MKNKLISFDVTQALERGVGDRVEGIDLNNSAAKEELRQAGIPMLSKALNESTDLGAIKSFFQSEAKRSELLSLGMIDVPGESFRVMQEELTFGQFNQFMKAREDAKNPYQPDGPGVAQFLDFLSAVSSETPLTYINANDCNAYIEWRNSQPGSNGKIRLMTEAEAIILRRDKIKLDLSGGNWEWTSTPEGGSKVLRCLGLDYRHAYSPVVRFLNIAVRLVEDI
jgi:hypothetical protein